MNDSGAEAADWQAYAVFLNDQGYAKPLAYACLVRAETILRGTNAGPLPSSVQLRAELESALGKDAASIHRNPAPLLEQAPQLSK